MDLKHYYQKIKEIESKIVGLFTVIVSADTPDGGKAGTATEVSRSLAARMIVQGVARLATPEEVQSFQRQRSSAPPANK
jgi:hypothetical protein